ncbi:hypothetical protein A4G20_09290 [Pasteurellaceae bacterium RH1A]|nr:hypothetical protein A4G20_09290 [Pasteurellaceae bacterium RH1A]
MLKITLFTDPMMGLTYESQPFLRKIETHFADQIQFETKMAGLVRDVGHFMMADDFREGDEQALKRYNRRLARIYQAEQGISGMPIHISPENLALFDQNHRSSTPLNLAVKAVELADKARADAFLYRLAYALIVETRPITHFEEILRVADLVGVDKNRFIRHFQDGSAQAELEKDRVLRSRLQIRSLPAYLLEYQGKSLLLEGVATDKDLMAAIEQISDSKIQAKPPQSAVENLHVFLQKHPLVSLIELQYAFGLESQDDVRKWLEPWLERGEIELVGGGAFASKTKKAD